MLRRRAVALATQWRAAQSVAAASLSSASCCTYSSALEEQLDTVDCVVVGAGVVGLACARAAALAGREVVLLEAAPTWGTVTSSRHSEVIHAGIYYPPGSLKAALCVEGRQLLYEYCVRRGVAHAQLGKLIVATSEQQVPQLEQLQRVAAGNGVHNLQLLSGAEASALEPELSAAAALLSPSTGILDSHGYMDALLADAQAAGALFAPNSRLLSAQQVPAATFPSAAAGQSAAGSSRIDSSSSSSSSSTQPPPRQLLQLSVQDSGSGVTTQLCTRWLVNAAGLAAQQVAASISPAPAAIPARCLAKGNYFSLSGRPPFARLIYPLPEPGGLGVHLTLDLGGAARFGPDVQWTGDDADYAVDPACAAAFYPQIRRYWPGLPDDALAPAYSGIRPKLTGPGEPAADFVLQGRDAHGVRGLVNLYGIESPGLTSSLALAQAVLRMMAS